MTEQQQTTQEQAPNPESEDKRDLSWHLDRIWDEIKQISRQVEQETRRGGRIARLRLDIRGLRRDCNEQAAKLGQLIYEAQMAGAKRPTLSRIEGYDDLIAKIAGFHSQIEAKESEITELKNSGEEDPQ